MGGEIYVYYTVTLPAQQETRCAVTAMQDALRAAHAGLTTRLLRRAGTSNDGTQTWMEIYRREGGIDAELEAEIARRGALACGAGVGSRHVEVFEPMGDDEPWPSGGAR